MKSKSKRTSRAAAIRFLIVGIICVGVLAAVWRQSDTAKASPSNNDIMANLYKKAAPNFDLNRTRGLGGLRVANGAQLTALANLKTAVNAPNMTTRWNDFGGSPDVLYDFASAPYSGTPEQGARAFISQHASLFGVSDMNNFVLFSDTPAMGGHLLRFRVIGQNI